MLLRKAPTIRRYEAATESGVRALKRALEEVLNTVDSGRIDGASDVRALQVEMIERIN